MVRLGGRSVPPLSERTARRDRFPRRQKPLLHAGRIHENWRLPRGSEPLYSEVARTWEGACFQRRLCGPFGKGQPLLDGGLQEAANGLR
jgi:hypothetical protein